MGKIFCVEFLFEIPHTKYLTQILTMCEDFKSSHIYEITNIFETPLLPVGPI